MRILIFGATGMVGQGVLRECLEAPDVERVVAVGRSPTGLSDQKFGEWVLPQLFDLSASPDRLAGFDACFFCLGVSSVGMKEPEYSRTTFDLTLGVARLLRELNSAMIFTYVSGAGTDSTERGRLMWARVKGRTENALLALGFEGAYMFRPGVIQPMHRVRSKTPLYRLVYAAATPLFGLMRTFWPRSLVTSVDVGRAMLTVARRGWPRAVLEVPDIQDAAK